MAHVLPLHLLEAWAEELVIGPRNPRRGPVADMRTRCTLMVSLHRRAAAAYPLPEDWPFCAMAPQRAER